jgi:hypothetical protein
MGGFALQAGQFAALGDRENAAQIFLFLELSG